MAELTTPEDPAAEEVTPTGEVVLNLDDEGKAGLLLAPLVEEVMVVVLEEESVEKEE